MKKSEYPDDAVATGLFSNLLQEIKLVDVSTLRRDFRMVDAEVEIIENRKASANNKSVTSVKKRNSSDRGGDDIVTRQTLGLLENK